MVPGTGIETGTRSTTSPRSVAQGRLFGTRDFKSRASASFATRAGFAFKSLLYTLSACRFDCGEICGECGPIFGKFLAGAFLSQDRILHDLRAGMHIALAYRDRAVAH